MGSYWSTPEIFDNEVYSLQDEQNERLLLDTGVDKNFYYWHKVDDFIIKKMLGEYK